jgi:hypothetical protein
MAEIENADQEPTASEQGTVGTPKGTQFLKKAYRDLDEAELTNPAVLRFLLADIDRLRDELSELRPFREQSYRLSTRVAVLEEETKSILSFEILSAAGLAVGAALVGYSRYLWDSPPNGYFALAFGIVLMVGGLAARLVKR